MSSSSSSSRIIFRGGGVVAVLVACLAATLPRPAGAEDHLTMTVTWQPAASGDAQLKQVFPEEKVKFSWTSGEHSLW